MNLLIIENTDQVKSILYKALEKLISNRINDKAFTDEEDVKDKSYFSTLEGLETILIPALNLPKNHFWEPLNNKYPELIDIIIDDINFVLPFNTENSPPDDQGKPYFEMRKGSRRVPYWTSECSSFTLSVLTNFLRVRKEFGFPGGPTDENVIAGIQKNLEWIKFCKRDKDGWSWTNNSYAHEWPTWSLLDTFEEMLNCELYKGEIHDSLSRICNEVIDNKVKDFFSLSAPNSKKWQDKIITSRLYNVEAALDLTRLMLAISLHRDKKIVQPLANKLYLWASKSSFSNVDYRYHLKERADYINDSSLIPCVFRTLIVMAGVLKPKRIKDLDNFLGQNHEIVLNKVYSKLMENKIPDGKYENLWGVRNGEIKYELYYTERIIESLTEFLIHYEKTAFKTDATLDSIMKTKKHIEKTPPITKKDESQDEETVPLKTVQLHILKEYARNIKNEEGEDLFKNKIIIYVLHFLNDLIPFTQKFKDMGCLHNDMYFLSKTYTYPEKEKVAKFFRDKGCNIFTPKDSRQETFDQLTNDIAKQCIEKAEKENKKILIVEDGGYFAPLFNSEKYKEKADICCGAVEQTTKGYRRDLNIVDHQFPIITVANSQLKLYLEAPEVAETLQENIITIFKDHENKPIDQVNALILGIGTIGTELARALCNKRITVSVYDIDLEKRMKAEVSREPYSKNVLDNIDALEKFDIIIGTSGETSLKKGEDFWNLKHNAILASGSSERIEFNLSAIEDQSVNVKRDGIFTEYTIEKDKKIIRVLCDGEPINFALSGGISKPVLDPVYTEMFWAAAEIAAKKKLGNKMHEVPKEIEGDVYRLYKKFHRT